jgi:hypothetical protein
VFCCRSSRRPSQIDSVAVYLPPPSGYGPASTLLYFERNQLARQVAKPLARTLPLTIPPLPTAKDRAEERTIDRLTLPRLYSFSTVRVEGGGAELVLGSLR